MGRHHQRVDGAGRGPPDYFSQRFELRVDFEFKAFDGDPALGIGQHLVHEALRRSLLRRQVVIGFHAGLRVL
jgi:hypothetical protein